MNYLYSEVINDTNPCDQIYPNIWATHLTFLQLAVKLFDFHQGHGIRYNYRTNFN